MLNIIDQKIRRAFSEAAVEYDLLTSLHKEIGRELIKKVRDKDDYASILDIGMGTGWLTGRLAFWYPDAKIIGLDFAEGMIQFAKNHHGEGIQIIQADAHRLPFKDMTFDLLISNLAFQWIRDVQNVFQTCHQCLNSNGKMCITLFGHNTFKELFEALDFARNEYLPAEDLNIKRLIHKDDVKKALEQAGFKNVVIDYERIKVHFSDMMRLLKWIKDIGANHLEKRIFIGKDMLSRADEYYRENYSDKFSIYSTFEVIWVEADK